MSLPGAWPAAPDGMPASITSGPGTSSWSPGCPGWPARYATSPASPPLLAERGIDLVVLKQGIDTATVAGRFTFHVLAAMDEMLADLICEGTKEGLASGRARGRSEAASPGSLPGRPRWPGACTPRPAATGSAAIPSTRSPAPSQSPARPSTGTLTRTTPSGNRTRARGRGPSPARRHWRHLPCDHASGGRHGSGAGPRAAPAFRPHPCRAGLPCLRTPARQQARSAPATRGSRDRLAPPRQLIRADQPAPALRELPAPRRMRHR